MGRILAIDSSSRCPGFAVMEVGRIIHISSCDVKKEDAGPKRWYYILKHLEHILKEYENVSFAVFEGYAFGSFELSTLGEIAGILKWHLFLNEIPYGDVNPNTLKKFFTGAGNAKKSDMIAEATRRGYCFENDNEADAIALAHFGHAQGFEALNNTWPTTVKEKKPRKKPATK